MTDNIVIEKNVALAPLTTLQVGGAARFLVTVKTEQNIVDAFAFAETQNLPIFVLGGGSNLLISDAGFDGMVLKIALRGIEFYQNQTSVSVTAAAGENWDALVRLCVARNLAGIECLSGIPGSVGATPMQNVGAYGQEVAETIASVRVFDRATKEIKNLTNSECAFAYRTSIFNTTHANKFIVLSVTFNLELNGKPAVRYADLQGVLADYSEPNLSDVRETVLAIRAAKSMVICEKDENRRSAGSFFKNPIVEQGQFDQIEATAHRFHLILDEQRVPHFPAGDGKIKIPAAWLIEKSGFSKGFTRGRVGVSTNHTLAIVNRGEATAAEIVEFVREIQLAVKEKFNVHLSPEPIWLGF